MDKPIIGKRWIDKKTGDLFVIGKNGKICRFTLKQRQGQSRLALKKWNNRTPEEKKDFLIKFREKILDQTGEKNPYWKGGRKIDRGYVYVLKNGYPTAHKDGYILEHRYVMEQHLGRLLHKNEHVHHKNGIKNDNRIDNLELVVSTPHYGKIQCPHCLKSFSIR